MTYNLQGTLERKLTYANTCHIWEQNMNNKGAVRAVLSDYKSTQFLSRTDFCPSMAPQCRRESLHIIFSSHLISTSCMFGLISNTATFSSMCFPCRLSCFNLFQPASGACSLATYICIFQQDVICFECSTTWQLVKPKLW